MKYRKLGNTGLMVSEMCLGTMTYGIQVTEEKAIEIIGSALASGINFLDTADAYGYGRTEEIVGKAIKANRHSVVLATKVGESWQADYGINDIGLSRKHIMQGIEDSLRRLQTDYIDLYYAHLPDYNTPIEETLRAMDDLVHQGKVRYIACSNFSTWQLCKAVSVSELHNLLKFECIQPPYNLLTRDIEYELLPYCNSEGIGVCTYIPLASGLLTGKHDPKKPPAENTRFTLERLGPMYQKRFWSDINFEAVSHLKKIAEANGKILPQFALAWVLSNETVTSTIFGATSVEHLESNIGASKLKLSSEELEACDEVWRYLRPPRFFYGR
jgi:aryl-alcohol dehydrogenase-like predicted oxidoreductase